MPRQTVLERPIRVVGPATETIGDKAHQDIGALWTRAGETGALAGEGPVYGVYYDYESDHHGRYSVLIGRQSDRPAGPGEREILLPAGKYGVFSAQGKIPETVVALWDQVWKRWDQPKPRAYQVDFERYDGGPEEAAVDLFISLAP